MRIKTISAVSLSALTHDYDTLAQKVEHAVAVFNDAADAGSDLVVFPEALNHYCGNYPHAKTQMHFGDTALDDWQRPFAPLIDAAKARRVAVVIPVVVRDAGVVANRFYVVGRDGGVLGHYQKSVPTPIEIQQGVTPGNTPLIHWEGLKLGGAICFDIYYPWVFERQVRAGTGGSGGADLFLIPSFTPGGMHLNFYALNFSTPIILAYPQWSRIIDLDGRELAQGGLRNETIGFGYGQPLVTAAINFNRVVLFADRNQAKINDVLAKHKARVRVTFDQSNSIFVLESRDEKLDVDEIVREFGLISRRDYFAESLTSIPGDVSGALTPP
jgi:predicted amidohydrolase